MSSRRQDGKLPQRKRRSRKKGHQRMASSIIELYVDVPADRQANIFGQFDEHLKLIERTLNVTMIFRDGSLKILGSQGGAMQAKAIVEELNALAGRGNTITQQNVNYALSLAMEKIGSVMEEIDKVLYATRYREGPLNPRHWDRMLCGADPQEDDRFRCRACRNR